MKSVATIINDIDEFNLNIKKSALDSDWEKVEDLAASRHKLLLDFCENKDNTITQSALLKIKEKIDSSDSNIRSMITQQKESTIQSKLNLRKSYNAANEYRMTRNSST